MGEIRKKKTRKIVDLFAGGGGVSTGIEAATGEPVSVAVNHWPLAVEVHKANHPKTKHYVADVYRVKPEEAIGDGSNVWLLWASPDCTFHSVARGGKPVQQKIRMLPFSVIPWAARVKPQIIIVENVPELRRWGPLLKNNKPDPRRAGETFRAWTRKLERLGYAVDHRVLVASDYGAPTKRKRLFVVARNDGQPIAWPEPTHGSPMACKLNPKLQPWRTAAECIDWSLPCPSIFGRKRPLAPKTMARIFKGLRRFVLENPAPYVVPAAIVGAAGRAGQSHPTGADEPLGTVTGKNDRGVVVPVLTKFQQNSIGQEPGVPLDTVLAGAARFGLVTPHLVKVNHGGDDARAEQLNLPLSTVTAARRGHGLVVPHLVRTAHGEVDRRGKRRGQGEQTLEAPIPTVTGSNDFALVAPSLVAIDQQGRKDASGSAAAPLHTVVTKNRSAMVTAWLTQNYEGMVEKPLDGSPVPTIAGRDHHSLTTAALVKLRGECSGADPREPAPTITASGTHLAEVRAFLTLYYGNAETAAQVLTEPLRTVTAKARLGIVTVHVGGEPVDFQIVDIGFRMLRSHELLRATCGKYAAGYDLSAARTEAERVRLIGNMVPPELVEALVRANTTRRRPRRRAA